jgi:hypothetical protein
MTNTPAYWACLKVVKKPEEDIEKIITRAQCYKSFYGRNLRMLVISSSVGPRQAFPAKSNVCW